MVCLGVNDDHDVADQVHGPKGDQVEALDPVDRGAQDGS
jgi:hypothetical protein